MYYRNANCAVVVYDVTQTSSLNKDRSWIEELQRQSDPNITIALTSNKYDLESRTVIDTKPAKKYAEENKTLFYETSAKTGHNVNELFNAIVKRMPLESQNSQKRTLNKGNDLNSKR